MPSSLHSRGALAGAGTAASLIAAAVTSLLFAAGLIGFTAWPASDSPSMESVVVPGVASAAPAGAVGRATAVTLPGRAAAARTPVRRIAPRTLARPVARGGSAPARTPASGSTPAPVTSPTPVVAPSPPSVTRQVTSGVADTTTTVTHQLGSTAGGPVGSVITSTGDTVAQTLDNVGSITQPLLGG